MTGLHMNERIKVGNVYLELPKGLPGGPKKIVAEKSETPETIEVPAYASNENDPI